MEVNVTGSEFCYRQKGHAIKNTHAQYERPISFDSKVNVQVKFFFKSR